MTVDMLMSLLEEAKEEGIDGATEVRLLMQPSWPFEYSIGGWALRSDLLDAEEIEGDEVFHKHDFDGDQHQECLFLLEGKQLCYGNRDVFENYRRF